MLCDTHAPMATISPYKGVENDQDEMPFLNYLRMSLTAFSCIKIQTSLIKRIQSRDLWASYQIFPDKF